VLRMPAGAGNRLLAWLDALQRRHGVLGFPYAVVTKYVDDGGWRHAALITYYGFLSIFPILLVATSVVSRVLVNRPALREDMVEALLPPALQSTVSTALAAMPTSGLPLGLGIAGLVLSGTGVVFSAYETLNQLAGVPRRSRFHWISRYTRVVLMVVVVLVGGLGVAALTVASAWLPDQLQRAAASIATALVVFLVLVTAAALLVARRVPLRTSILPAATGAVVVTVVLALGARLLGPLVERAGPVYGSFATVAGIFTLLYLVSQALLYAAEVAVVQHRGLWPRALVTSRPTPADVAALTLLATVQERIPVQRVEVEFDRPQPEQW
jgi:membrane protein